MLEILRYIFSSFWVWLGTVVLLGLVGELLRSLLCIALRKDGE